jgi:SSS family transporter
VSIWVSSVTVGIYVALGGLLSAVFNEVLQFFLIWLGTLLVPILGIIHAGGWTKMMATVQKNAPIIHPTMQNADFTSLWRNLGSFDTNPMGINWFGMVFGLGLAVSFGYWCTDFLQVQRVLVAKNLRSAQNGTVIGAALKMCVPLIVTIPGLLGLAVLLNPDGSPMMLVPESDPRANITHRTFNDVLPLLMGQYLGPGLLGLGVTAMIAGFMSGMAGNVSAFATVWTYDVYRPLLNKKASDKHYLTMGRWCAILGVLISIGTAYALFYFSNILECLQVLVFFFIVPLFGTVILGMLWKRATPAGGFWGFLAAILFSMSMWVFVHTFPEGYRPQPKVSLQKGAIVTLDKTVQGKTETVNQVTVESGTVDLVNVPVPADPGEKSPVGASISLVMTNRAGKAEVISGEFTVQNAAAVLPAVAKISDSQVNVQVLAPEVVLSDSQQTTKFGVAGVPVVLKPGVKVQVKESVSRFVPAAFNEDHTQYVALSKKAQGMAVNMYSAFWSLLVCMGVTIGVSLFTKPKPEAELKDLVFGLTEVPHEGPCPWYRSPKLWAAVIFVVLVAINVIFW